MNCPCNLLPFVAGADISVPCSDPLLNLATACRLHEADPNIMHWVREQVRLLREVRDGMDPIPPHHAWQLEAIGLHADSEVSLEAPRHDELCEVRWACNQAALDANHI